MYLHKLSWMYLFSEHLKQYKCVYSDLRCDAVTITIF